MTNLTLEELQDALSDIIPGCQIKNSKKGIIIYTFLSENDYGELVPLDEDDFDEEVSLDADEAESFASEDELNDD